MYYVYILQCSDNKLYTGYTTDIDKRLKRHETGQVFSTKSRLPVELIFYEAFVHIQDAKRREQYLKTTAGKKAVKLMMRRYFNDKKHR